MSWKPSNSAEKDNRRVESSNTGVISIELCWTFFTRWYEPWLRYFEMITVNVILWKFQLFFIKDNWVRNLYFNVWQHKNVCLPFFFKVKCMYLLFCTRSYSVSLRLCICCEFWNVCILIWSLYFHFFFQLFLWGFF